MTQLKLEKGSIGRGRNRWFKPAFVQFSRMVWCNGLHRQLEICVYSSRYASVAPIVLQLSLADVAEFGIRLLTESSLLDQEKDRILLSLLDDKSKEINKKFRESQP